VVATGLLQLPAVRNWLGGIEPAWTLLDQASFAALHSAPSPMAGPIRLASDLTPSEVQKSAVARNALILLGAAATGPGLKMTATGNLSRDVVAEMIDRFTWPGFDETHAFQFHKVINEPDFLPLFFVRHVVEAGKLLHRHKGYLKITPTGRRMLEEVNQSALQAVLLHLALSHLDLGYLDRGLHHGWPQRDIGIVLWCLSIAANDWESRERLTRLCTIPINRVLDTPWDTLSHAMEATVLRPLLWFGLVEYREEDIPDERFEKMRLYCKTPLFDRFLSFDVTLETTGGPRQ
jgi:hypothetical protein